MQYLDTGHRSHVDAEQHTGHRSSSNSRDHGFSGARLERRRGEMERFRRRIVQRYTDHDFGHLPGACIGDRRLHGNGDGNFDQRLVEVCHFADQGQPVARGNDKFPSGGHCGKQLQPSLG